MSDADFNSPSRMAPREMEPSERREDLRLATQHLVKLHHDPTIFGELTNLSRAGAEVELNGDRRPDIDATTTLELLDGTTVPAVVVWRRGRAVGLKFDLRFADASELLHLDHLGQDLFLSIVRHQKLRANLAD